MFEILLRLLMLGESQL